MLGINFKNDSWRNFYKKSKAIKDQSEQNLINQGTLDYIHRLQIQIDDLTARVRDLEERDRKKRFGDI